MAHVHLSLFGGGFCGVCGFVVCCFGCGFFVFVLCCFLFPPTMLRSSSCPPEPTTVRAVMVRAALEKKHFFRNDHGGQPSHWRLGCTHN